MTNTTNADNSLAVMNKKSRKNSIVELLRFLFSLWVLYFHGYVPYRNDFFSDGKLAVEFFFVLSGFYLVRSMKKYEAQPTFKGLKTFLYHRFKAISTVFIIGEIFVLIHSLVFDFSYNFLFGYLWYVRDLFLAMAFFFVMKKLLKKDVYFYIFIAALSIFSIFISGKIPGCAEWPGGAFRAFASMPLGMLAAIIPQLPQKIKGRVFNITSAVIAVIGFVVTGLFTLWLAASTEKTQNMIYLMVIIGFPTVLYFANQIRLNIGFLNWLGTLSFPIYAFQCILRVLEQFGISDGTHHFVIITVLVFTFSLTMKLISRYNLKKNIKV